MQREVMEALSLLQNNVSGSASSFKLSGTFFFRGYTMHGGKTKPDAEMHYVL